MPAATTDAPLAGPLDDQLTARLLQQRIIVLGAEVDDQIANRLCAQLLLLSAEDPRSDISLYINSPGGSVSAGMAIYDTMQLIPNDVRTLAMGLAGSMGQFLLCAGAAGKRFSLPHAQVLMHQGSAGFGGTAADIEIYAGQLERTGRTLMGLGAQHTGQPLERVEQDTLRDRWFDSEEAPAVGLHAHSVELPRPDVANPCMGQASSAAAVLLAAGTPGKRTVLKHAKVLLHQPSAEARGALPDLAVQAKEVARIRDEMEEILARHTGHPVARIRQDTDRDKTFSAQEAVDYGLAAAG